jgi:hypothetical protein
MVGLVITGHCPQADWNSSSTVSHAAGQMNIRQAGTILKDRPFRLVGRNVRSHTS